MDGNTTTYFPPDTTVFGVPSATNPVSGSAVWSGQARAFHHRNWTATQASARIEVDFAATTVDITDFNTDHPDMSWADMPLSAGTFSDTAIDRAIDGSFYGATHEAVAGTFHSDQLQGVFGAVRKRHE